jgi:hypothetical protein
MLHRIICRNNVMKTMSRLRIMGMMLLWKALRTDTLRNAATNR